MHSSSTAISIKLKKNLNPTGTPDDQQHALKGIKKSSECILMAYQEPPYQERKV
jgi:hypothetical protein